MYDVISVTEGDLAILHCMKEECARNPESMPCKVHEEIERIQKILIEELKKKSIGDIMEDKEGQENEEENKWNLKRRLLFQPAQYVLHIFGNRSS